MNWSKGDNGVTKDGAIHTILWVSEDCTTARLRCIRKSSEKMYVSFDIDEEWLRIGDLSLVLSKRDRKWLMKDNTNE